MSSTTILLPDELKARVASAAERAGTSEHDFIIQGIEEKINREEKYDEFNEIADQRYANIVATDETISSDDMDEYIKKRIAGETVNLPAAKKRSR